MGTFEARSAGSEAHARSPHLGRLSLRDYRNFEGLVCEFPAAGVAIIGPNGAGKTNLLEAIYYLQIFRSFRGSRDAQLVRFGADVFRVEGEMAFGEELATLTAAYERSTRRKKIVTDEREPERIADAIGRLGAVAFRLGDVEIVRGAPSERRRYLDVLLSLSRPGYLPALQRFRAALGQRNEALRAASPDPVVDAWTTEIVERGGVVMAERARWLAGRADAFREYYRTISGGTPARLAYGPALGPGDPERGDDGAAETEHDLWRERLAVGLEKVRDRERRRGMTLAGPHRDEVSIVMDPPEEQPRELRSFGSSGQQRTAALALRLIETDTLRERIGREPIYLLDDVFAELDEGRSERVLDLLETDRSGQVILTAPKQEDARLRGGGLERWRIRNGRILA